MSLDANKALDRRYAEEVLDQGKVEVIDEICSPDYVSHVAGSPPMGREGDKQLVAMLHAAFPDLHCVIEDQIAGDDRVLHRLTCRGTHRGEFQGIPPTGNEVTVTAMNINRIAGGKIVESWGVMDTLSLLQQLGVVPTPASAV